MGPDRGPGASLRLFVALDLPIDVRRALAQWAATAAPAGARLLAEHSLHVTLAFLGSCSRAQADTIATLLPAVAAPVGELRSAGALWLGPRRAPVLTVALATTPALQALHGALAAALSAAVGYAPEPRPFRPHVTVARVAHASSVQAVGLPEPPTLTFAAQALTLYRSHAQPGGSRYEPV